jgi:hypothetical protein
MDVAARAHAAKILCKRYTASTRTRDESITVPGASSAPIGNGVLTGSNQTRKLRIYKAYAIDAKGSYPQFLPLSNLDRPCESGGGP